MFNDKQTHFLRTILAVLFFTTTTALCLGPHECVLLVNRQSRDSVELANHYAHMRQIPGINIIHLNLPEKALEAGASFTPDEFREFIYEPVQKELSNRGIAGHILVWLYSADFPTVIETKPRMSLTGMTFVRGRVPDAKSISSGKWHSPIFTGPDNANGPLSPPASMEEFTLRLTTNMPLPSMMIGWTGSRGMTIEQTTEHLRRSVASDGSHPSASVYFEVTEDVRSKTRSWQFDRTSKELAGLGVAAFSVSNAPIKRPDIMGILAGRPSFNNDTYGELRPGSYADHLTSFAGVFHDSNQRKLTEWLRRGASGSSGTITEPGSLTEPVVLWTKFPHARLFSHYASGCTLIESLFLSIRCPLQLLLVGDALCNPWAKPPGITLVNMAEDETVPIKGKAEFLASSWGGFGQQPPTIIFFLDGRPVTPSGEGNIFSADTSPLHDGSHSLRVVAYSAGTIRHQGFDEATIQTRNRARSTTISGYEPNQRVDIYHNLAFQVSAEGSPREAAIIAQERVIARASYTNNLTIFVPPFAVGAGPVSFQAVTIYNDNRPVRSEPLLLNVTPLNESAQITSISILTNDNESLVMHMTAEDPDNDTPNIQWYIDALKHSEAPTVVPDENKVKNIPGSGTFIMAALQTPVCATMDVDTPTRIKELRTILRFSEGYNITSKDGAGVIFNYLDENNYMFWGIDGKRSAWVLSRIDNGQKKTILSRGAPLETRKDYDVMILAIDNGEMGFFVNNNLLAVADASFAAGRIGLRNGIAKTEYNHLFVSPPSAFRSYYREQTDDLVVDAEHKETLNTIFGAARDVQFTAFKKVW